MKCHHCGHDDTRVVESRPLPGAVGIRRRRACDNCGKRFSTFEIDAILWRGIKGDALERRSQMLLKRNARLSRDEQIADMIHRGVSYETISSRFNIALSTIANIARRNEIPKRESLRIAMQERSRVVMDLLRAGKTRKEVALQIGVSPETIRRVEVAARQERSAKVWSGLL